METLEQRLHELDCKVRQMKEERDNVVAENEELQEQLDQANSTASAGNMRINELRNDVNKLVEEVSRVDYMCTSQEHELKALSDRMCDLGQLKETVKELSEDSKTLKEDFGRVKTHLNVAAKLELQTQEKMYESRLYHLENVLEEMRQREGHFMRLAEETAVLKDQVDALRELSVISLKQDERAAETSKCRVVSDELSSATSTPLRRISDLQLHLAVLREGDKTLDKEMGSKENFGPSLMSSAPEVVEIIPTMTSPEEDEPPLSVLTQADEETTKEMDTSGDNSQNGSISSGETGSDVLEEIETSNRGMEEYKVYENAKLMLMQTEEANTLGAPSIKVSGTLKLIQPKSKENRKDEPVGGCLPNCLVSIWGYLFD